MEAQEKLERYEAAVNEDLSEPMTRGVLHPAIVLPRGSQAWDAGGPNRAIVHELEHVRRADWTTQCLARMVCVAYWVHPLVWMTWHRLCLEAERRHRISFSDAPSRQGACDAGYQAQEHDPGQQPAVAYSDIE